MKTHILTTIAFWSLLLAGVGAQDISTSLIDDIYYKKGDEKKAIKKQKPVEQPQAAAKVERREYEALKANAGNRVDGYEAATQGIDYESITNSYMSVIENNQLREVDTMVYVNDLEGEYVNRFNGSRDDYEYAERLRRYHGVRGAIFIGEPGYYDVVYGNSYDWNVYSDGMYAWVTPTWSNSYYWDYRYSYPYGYYGRYNWGYNSPWGYYDPWNRYDYYYGYGYYNNYGNWGLGFGGYYYGYSPYYYDNYYYHGGGYAYTSRDRYYGRRESGDFGTNRRPSAYSSSLNGVQYNASQRPSSSAIGSAERPTVGRVAIGGSSSRPTLGGTNSGTRQAVGSGNFSTARPSVGVSGTTGSDNGRASSRTFNPNATIRPAGSATRPSVSVSGSSGRVSSPATSGGSTSNPTPQFSRPQSNARPSYNPPTTSGSGSSAPQYNSGSGSSSRPTYVPQPSSRPSYTPSGSSSGSSSRPTYTPTPSSSSSPSYNSSGSSSGSYNSGSSGSSSRPSSGSSSSGSSGGGSSSRPSSSGGRR